MTDHDKLCAAIGIVQLHILASDSVLIPEKMFGLNYMPNAALELAEKLLVEVLPTALDWPDPANERQHDERKPVFRKEDSA